MRLTAAQALVRFLAAQHVERDGVRHRFFGGCFGIFGHGNVGHRRGAARAPRALPYHQARNEQGMVHAAVGYARMRNRLGDARLHELDRPRRDEHGHRRRASRPSTGCRCCCCRATSSPATAPIPCSSSSRCRRPATSRSTTASGPVSRYFDRISRPEQVIPAALAAMRVLTSPAETGAVTLAFPQDVQAEAFDYPEEFFAERVWHVPRPAARASRAGRGGRGDPRVAAAADRRGRRRHLLGGDRRAARVLRRDRHPGRRDAGGQGLAAATTTPRASARSARPGRSPRTGSPPPPTS